LKLTMKSLSSQFTIAAQPTLFIGLSGFFEVF
jgi:hypothetical protein